MNRNWLMLAVVALAAACSPYEDADSGPAHILSVLTSSGSYGSVTDGTETAGAWSVAEVPSFCDPVDGTLSEENIIWIILDKQISAASVQTTLPDPLTGDPGDCTPTGGWLTVTPAAPAGFAWYSCYVPSGPQSSEGGSIVIFLATDAAPASGQDEWDYVSGVSDDFTSYTLTGSVDSKDGTPVDIDVTVGIAPDAGDVGTFAASALSGDPAPSVTLDWTAPTCGSESRIKVLRSPHGAGTFVEIANLAPGSATYTDATVVNGEAYDWEIVTEIDVAAVPFPEVKAGVSYGIVNPAAAPTFTGTTQTSTTVNWVAVAGATGYDLQRANDAAGVPGSFSTYQVGLTGTSYTDPSLLPNRIYWYRILPTVDGVRRLADSPSASVTTLP